MKNNINKIKYCNNGIFTLNCNDYIDNTYYKQNPQMFCLMCDLLNNRKLFNAAQILTTSNRSSLSNWIYSITSKLHDCKFTERLYWILNDMHEFPKCQCPQCNKLLCSYHFVRISFGYIQYCSKECQSKSPFPYIKAKMTNSLKTNQEKRAIVEKSLATKKRHAEEDPTYKERVLQKSIATRKQNHGEDYTGRKKCQQTMKERYGVENPMHIESVKQHLKQYNLDTYGIEWHIASSEIRNKSQQTCQKHYGVSNPFAASEVIEQIKAQNLKLYGVEYSWQREDVKQRIKDTNKQLYGYENAMQNPQIRAKAQMNLIYNGKSFDSYSELCVYLWLVDHKINFEYQPNISFQYEHNSVIHHYCPDFKICGMFYEVKGDHFFKDKDPSKQMVCPYNHALDELYEAKHQCMLHNHIIVITSSTYQQFIDYVEQKYGKELYQSLKAQKQQRFDAGLHNVKSK